LLTTFFEESAKPAARKAWQRDLAYLKLKGSWVHDARVETLACIAQKYVIGLMIACLHLGSQLRSIRPAPLLFRYIKSQQASVRFTLNQSRKWGLDEQQHTWRR